MMQANEKSEFDSDNNCEQKTDSELAKLTLTDRNFFAILINRYQKKLLYFILRISSFDSDEAEDILQNVFLKVYKNLNDFDQDLKFSSWIYRITRNEVINHHRKDQSGRRVVFSDIDNETIENIAADLDLNKEVDNLLLKKKINQALLKVDKKYQEVLILRFFEEKDYKEISDIIKKPMGSVATLINRAKKKLREELKI